MAARETGERIVTLEYGRLIFENQHGISTLTFLKFSFLIFETEKQFIELSGEINEMKEYI